MTERDKQDADASAVGDMLDKARDTLESAAHELTDLCRKTFKREWLDCLAWYRAHVETVDGVYHEHRDLERSGLLRRRNNMPVLDEVQGLLSIRFNRELPPDLPDLTEQANHLGVQLDKTENMRVSAGRRLNELFATRFASNSAAFHEWYGHEVWKREPGRAWRTVKSYVEIPDPPKNSPTRRGNTADPNDIIVGERLRPLNPERVAELERSITTIGLQTPITVRYVDWRPTLIAGAHRLEAVKNLGWSEIAVREFQGDEREARMWEIAENLHRAELTVLERSVQVAEWIRLANEKVAQVAPVSDKGGRGHEGGINAASRELGIERTDAQRAAKIDNLTPEAKAAAVELGLDDNQSALLEAAKAETAGEQVEALKQRKATKSTAKAVGQPAQVKQPNVANDDAAPEAPTLRNLPFEIALAQFKSWYAGLTPNQQVEVDHVMEEVEAVSRTPIPVEEPAVASV